MGTTVDRGNHWCAGETVFDLIQYAGGLTADAADNIGLSRIKPMGERNSEGAYEGHYINIEMPN